MTDRRRASARDAELEAAAVAHRGRHTTLGEWLDAMPLGGGRWLAQTVGCSVEYVSRLRKGRRCRSVDLLYQLHIATGVPMESLAGRRSS